MIKKTLNTQQENDQVLGITPSKTKNRDINNIHYLYYLGGFVEGEGSNSIAISVNKNFKYGINLQPIFNVTQHVKGIELLNSFKELFGVGSVLPKSGSPDVYVYTVKGYKNMIKYIIPFLKNYVQPFSCKTMEYDIFTELVYRSQKGDQKNKEKLIEMVHIAYSLSGKGNIRKRSLEEIINIINDKKSYFISKQ